MRDVEESRAGRCGVELLRERFGGDGEMGSIRRESMEYVGTKGRADISEKMRSVTMVGRYRSA